MILVLCDDTKLPHIFPEAVSVCPTYSCPADDCMGKGKEGTCVVGVKDGEPTCLGYFALAVDTFGCDCTTCPCEHLTLDHPAMEPIFKRLQMWHEPLADRVARAKAATRATILGTPLELPDAKAMHRKLLTDRPEVAQRLPLREEEHNGSTSTHAHPERG